MGLPGLLDNRLEEPLGAVLDRVPAEWRAMVQAWRATAPAARCWPTSKRGARPVPTVFPAAPLAALALTPLSSVRVVILGQDPYHGPGQAEGLAFSVPVGVRIPPSLRNIFVELQRDLGIPSPRHGHLASWAQQGVLLLNTTLTVEEGQPGLHARKGWETLTDAVIEAVAALPQRIVFMLWGAHAQAKAPLVQAAGSDRHLVLRANHPSPLAARRPPLPFIGCGHFSAAMAAGVAVDWSIR